MKKVLVVAPHADDETLGVGGTIARHVAEGDEVTVAVMTGHGDEPHPLWGPEAWDTVRGEALEAWRVLGVHDWLFREIPAACVADRPTYEVNGICDEVLKTVGPDVLYVPFQYDLHLGQDASLFARIERVVDRFLHRRDERMGRVVEAKDVSVLLEELGDGDVTLFFCQFVCAGTSRLLPGGRCGWCHFRGWLHNLHL